MSITFTMEYEDNNVRKMCYLYVCGMGKQISLSIKINQDNTVTK